jgi:hypothetical protein
VRKCDGADIVEASIFLVFVYGKAALDQMNVRLKIALGIRVMVVFLWLPSW